ncbi:SCO family protein [bacterium]|nr:SCO family protein [bacterium]
MNARTFAIPLLLLLAAAAPLHAQLLLDDPKDLQGINIEEQLGGQVPGNLRFVNAEGDSVTLGDYFNGDIPTAMVLHYSDCPMLCSLVLDGVVKMSKEVGFTAGEEYRLLAVSIDPSETWQRTAAMQKRYRALLPDDAKPGSWHFLVGDEQNIQALADAIGFKYYWHEKTQQYAHAAAMFVLTGNGKISRYLYGIEFKKQDARLALLEAGKGKIGSTVDKLILSCFHYDPDAGSYTLFAANVMKLGGLLTMVLLGGVIGGLFLREKRLKKKRAAADERSPDQDGHPAPGRR